MKLTSSLIVYPDATPQFVELGKVRLAANVVQVYLRKATDAALQGGLCLELNQLAANESIVKGLMERADHQETHYKASMKLTRANPELAKHIDVFLFKYDEQVDFLKSNKRWEELVMIHRDPFALTKELAQGAGPKLKSLKKIIENVLFGDPAVTAKVDEASRGPLMVRLHCLVMEMIFKDDLSELAHLNDLWRRYTEETLGRRLMDERERQCLMELQRVNAAAARAAGDAVGYRAALRELVLLSGDSSCTVSKALVAIMQLAEAGKEGLDRAADRAAARALVLNAAELSMRISGAFPGIKGAATGSTSSNFVPLKELMTDFLSPGFEVTTATTWYFTVQSHETRVLQLLQSTDFSPRSTYHTEASEVVAKVLEGDLTSRPELHVSSLRATVLSFAHTVNCTLLQHAVALAPALLLNLQATALDPGTLRLLYKEVAAPLFEAVGRCRAVADSFVTDVFKRSANVVMQYVMDAAPTVEAFRARARYFFPSLATTGVDSESESDAWKVPVVSLPGLKDFPPVPVGVPLFRQSAAALTRSVSATVVEPLLMPAACLGPAALYERAAWTLVDSNDLRALLVDAVVARFKGPHADSLASRSGSSLSMADAQWKLSQTASQFRLVILLTSLYPRGPKTRTVPLREGLGPDAAALTHRDVPRSIDASESAPALTVAGNVLKFAGDAIFHAIPQLRGSLWRSPMNQSSLPGASVFFAIKSLRETEAEIGQAAQTLATALLHATDPAWTSPSAAHQPLPLALTLDLLERFTAQLLLLTGPTTWLPQSFAAWWAPGCRWVIDLDLGADEDSSKWSIVSWKSYVFSEAKSTPLPVPASIATTTATAERVMVILERAVDAHMRRVTDASALPPSTVSLLLRAAFFAATCALNLLPVHDELFKSPHGRAMKALERILHLLDRHAGPVPVDDRGKRARTLPPLHQVLGALRSVQPGAKFIDLLRILSEALLVWIPGVQERTCAVILAPVAGLNGSTCQGREIEGPEELSKIRDFGGLQPLRGYVLPRVDAAEIKVVAAQDVAVNPAEIRKQMLGELTERLRTFLRVRVLTRGLCLRRVFAEAPADVKSRMDRLGRDLRETRERIRGLERAQQPVPGEMVATIKAARAEMRAALAPYLTPVLDGLKGALRGRLGEVREAKRLRLEADKAEEARAQVASQEEKRLIGRSDVLPWERELAALRGNLDNVLTSEHGWTAHHCVFCTLLDLQGERSEQADTAAAAAAAALKGIQPAAAKPPRSSKAAVFARALGKSFLPHCQRQTHQTAVEKARQLHAQMESAIGPLLRRGIAALAELEKRQETLEPDDAAAEEMTELESSIRPACNAVQSEFGKIVQGRHWADTDGLERQAAKLMEALTNDFERFLQSGPLAPPPGLKKGAGVADVEGDDEDEYRGADGAQADDDLEEPFVVVQRTRGKKGGNGEVIMKGWKKKEVEQAKSAAAAIAASKGAGGGRGRARGGGGGSKKKR